MTLLPALTLASSPDLTFQKASKDMTTTINYACLGCGKPGVASYCDACYEWGDFPTLDQPGETPGVDQTDPSAPPDPDPAPGRTPQVGDRVVLHPSIADGDAYHQFGIVIGTPGFTESASPDPVPYYSVNFDCADGTVENLWLDVGQILLASEENPDDDSPPVGPDPERCRFCSGSHHIQKCPSIHARLGNPGRAINRQWTCDTRRFATILRSLDPSVWYLLAAPCAQYRGMTTPEVLDRWERLARGVELPASAREAA